MASRFARTARDPARDAAGMLRRLGFAVLVLAAPVTAVLTRRGLVICVPVGIALMVLASFIESEARQPFLNAWRGMRTRAAASIAFILFWSALSLLWTPFPNEAAERLVNASGIVVLAWLGVASVPEKMRASNLYLLPVGIGVASLVAIALWPNARWQLVSSLDPALTERGLATLAVAGPMAAAWLHSRGRGISALVLGLVLVIACVIYEAWPILTALLVAAVVYGLYVVAAPRTREVAAVVLAALVLFAPVLPFLARPFVKLLLGATSPQVEAIRVWSRVVAEDPVRWFTGHGLDTALRAVLAGLVPAGAPRGLLFEIWFELGFLGAAALALLLWSAARGTSKLERAVGPGALATIVAAFLIATLGVAGTQSWWLVSIVIACVAVFAVNQGQFRTKRPKSTIAPPPRAT